MKLLSYTMTGLVLFFLAVSSAFGEIPEFRILTITVHGDGIGRVTPFVGSRYIYYGEPITVEAVAETGSFIIGWMYDGQVQPFDESHYAQSFPMYEDHWVDITLTPRDPKTVGNLQGTVWSQTDGIPVTCAAVVADGPGGVFVANTNMLGSYYFSGLLAGNYDVSVYSTCCEGTLKQTYVLSQRTNEVHFFLLPRSVPPTVDGTVTNSVTGLPLGGVLVQAVNGTDILDMTYTCSSGEYALTFGISPITLYYSANGYYSSVRTVSVPVKTTTVDETLWSKSEVPGTLTGIVINTSTAAGVSGAQVQATLTSTTTTTYTIAGGNFSISGLDAGTYNVIVSMSGYGTGFTTAVVPSGGGTVYLTPTGGGGGGGGGCAGVVAPTPSTGGDMVLLAMLPVVMWLAAFLLRRRSWPKGV